jgi:hypothetical protein
LDIDFDCRSYCRQGDHPDLVGVLVFGVGNVLWSESEYCECQFSGQVPDDISLSDYNPGAFDGYPGPTGKGKIASVQNKTLLVCYQTDVSAETDLKMILNQCLNLLWLYLLELC